VLGPELIGAASEENQDHDRPLGGHTRDCLSRKTEAAKTTAIPH
jgi:hypothetical protein